jgi:hypothetical protein
MGLTAKLEDIVMSTLKTLRQQGRILIVATLLALAAAYSPLLLDSVAGTTLTPQAQACQHTGGGC